MRTLYALVVAATMTLTLAAPATAGPAPTASRGPKPIDSTALVPPGGSATAFATPSDQALTLSRFCADPCVRCSGATVGSSPFAVASGRCVNHSPAIALPAGEQVRCESRCPSTAAVLLDGELRSAPQRVASSDTPRERR